MSIEVCGVTVDTVAAADVGDQCTVDRIFKGRWCGMTVGACIVVNTHWIAGRMTAHTHRCVQHLVGGMIDRNMG